MHILLTLVISVAACAFVSALACTFGSPFDFFEWLGRKWDERRARQEFRLEAYVYKMLQATRPDMHGPPGNLSSRRYWESVEYRMDRALTDVDRRMIVEKYLKYTRWTPEELLDDALAREDYETCKIITNEFMRG